jgi:hypothetical protein
VTRDHLLQAIEQSDSDELTELIAELLSLRARVKVRTPTLNDDMRDSFARWYPGMASASTSQLPLAV